MDVYRGIPLVISAGKVISSFLLFHFLIYVLYKNFGYCTEYGIASVSYSKNGRFVCG
jgi:hypothetical protein